MREVNFSIPNINKASVYITPTLYDRRALDCTSTLPLINSLNHLSYLTISSARIRDILTVDGGIERLICILKEGRSRDEMHMWKWNLALQCIVNIGVRGTEPVRTRVVEADMVPVIATILHDYILVTDRERKRNDKDIERPRTASTVAVGPRGPRLLRDPLQVPSPGASFLEHQLNNSETRRPPPPSLDLSQQFPTRFNGEPSRPIVSPPPPVMFTSPPERTTFARPPITQHRSHDSRNPFRSGIGSGSATSVPEMPDAFSIRPVREVDRLPSMLPAPDSAVPSIPDTPTTPVAPVSLLTPAGQRLRRSSIRQQSSTGDVTMEDVDPLATGNIVEQEVVAPARSGHGTDGDTTPRAIQDEDLPDPLNLRIPGTFVRDEDTVDIAQQTPTATTDLEGLLPREETNSPGPNAQPIPSPALPMNQYTQMYMRNPPSNQEALSLRPRDDDVILGLQLLAYISKYCDLRHYFQATHLVPRLRIDREVEKVYGVDPVRGALPPPTEDEMEEYLQPDNVNIFPLVEKFTVPYHGKDMRNWACVVMRNLCRKDDARNGTRQCANYRCGKWEEFPRQFAKCRRCKRTKYCRKECQRDSWSMHRHWCQTTPAP